MRRARTQRETRHGGLCPGRLVALAVALIGSGVTGGLIGPANAQRNWEPTVATAPGGSLNVPDVPRADRLPAMVDPRRFPPPARAPASGADDRLPQGAWSPLVTGAIPKPRPAPTSRGEAAKTAADAVQDRGVPSADGLSPVRPAPGGVVAAAPAQPAAADPVAVDGTEESMPLMKPGPLEALPPNASAAQQYCFNTADTAADARFAWQAKKIQEMEAELNKRAEMLAAKTEEYKTWLDRRDAFSRKAHEKLVGFYSRMRADAAAAQLATIDEETAAAVMTKLETKVASQIMGEMDPVRAARIASVIAGAAKTPPAARRAASDRGGAPPRSRDTAGSRGRPES